MRASEPLPLFPRSCCTSASKAGILVCAADSIRSRSLPKIARSFADRSFAPPGSDLRPEQAIASPVRLALLLLLHGHNLLPGEAPPLGPRGHGLRVLAPALHRDPQPQLLQLLYLLLRRDLQPPRSPLLHADSG